MTTAWPDLGPIAEGYYAVRDPDDPEQMTYWRRVRTKKTDALKAWPAKAWWGPPVPRRKDVPTDIVERDRFVAAWSESRRSYLSKIVTAITADTEGAARRFAELHTRCCFCGRALRDETSKTFGIGPECRSGVDPAVLARYCAPLVGRAHAEHLGRPRAGKAAS